MSLVSCPECEAQISDKAHACPHCGFPFASGELAETKKPTEDRVQKANLGPSSSPVEAAKTKHSPISKEGSEPQRRTSGSQPPATEFLRQRGTSSSLGKKAEMAQRKTILIEQTRKKYKATMLIGWIVLLIAVPVGLSTDSKFLLLIGLIAMGAVVGAWFLSWWHHG